MRYHYYHHFTSDLLLTKICCNQKPIRSILNLVDCRMDTAPIYNTIVVYLISFAKPVIWQKCHPAFDGQKSRNAHTHAHTIIECKFVTSILARTVSCTRWLDALIIFSVTLMVLCRLISPLLIRKPNHTDNVCVCVCINTLEMEYIYSLFWANACICFVCHLKLCTLGVRSF